MAKREREGVVVTYPDDMDNHTLREILGSILIEVKDEKSKPPRKEPKPEPSFRLVPKPPTKT
jgi:hypothetical protein